jgi:hypothetical protein
VKERKRRNNREEVGAGVVIYPFVFQKQINFLIGLFLSKKR